MVPCSTANEFMKSSESVISFISSAIVVSTTATTHQTCKKKEKVSLLKPHKHVIKFTDKHLTKYK